MKKQFLALSFIAITGINAENTPPIKMHSEQIRPSCTECHCDPFYQRDARRLHPIIFDLGGDEWRPL